MIKLKMKRQKHALGLRISDVFKFFEKYIDCIKKLSVVAKKGLIEHLLFFCYFILKIKMYILKIVIALR